MTTAQANSAENPYPVRAVAIRVAGWIDKLGSVWVEGQLKIGRASCRERV